MNFNAEFDYDAGIRATYNSLKIGNRIQILMGNKFKPGVIRDKYFEADVHLKVFIDVILDDKSVIEHYNCYSGFYPRYDLI